MNAKAVACILVACTLLCSCAGSRGASTDVVVEHTRAVAIAESRIASYERAVDETIRELGKLRERASSTERTIDELIELFDEYDKLVAELLRNYSGLRESIEAKKQVADYTVYDTDSMVSVETLGIYTICEGYQNPTMAGYSFVNRLAWHGNRYDK